MDDRDRAYAAIATIAAMASRIHGQIGVDEAFADAADAELDAVATGDVAVDVDDDVDEDEVVVDVEVDVDVDVDVEVVLVFVGGCVAVGVEVDVVIGDRLVVGASVVGSVVGASVLGETVAVREGSVGTEIGRETLGRFDPPPHDVARVTSTTMDAIGSAQSARSRSYRRRLRMQVVPEGMTASFSPRSTPSP